MTTTAVPPRAYDAPDVVPTYLRAARPGDQGYIASTWLQQIRAADRRYASGSRWGAAGRDVDAVLERDDTRALVRHAPGDLDAIRGWIVYAEGPGVPLIHGLYVRRDHRRAGVARELLGVVGARRCEPLVYTTRGPDAAALLKLYPRAAFMPLAEFLR